MDAWRYVISVGIANANVDAMMILIMMNRCEMMLLVLVMVPTVGCNVMERLGAIVAVARNADI